MAAGEGGGHRRQDEGTEVVRRGDAQGPERFLRRVGQFGELAADVIVIGAPMYNFNISAHLKNWIDAIVRPGVTFRYTETGPVGLVSGKTVHIALTRGGVYRGTPADIPVQYLTQVFAFIGVTDVQFVYAEGMSRGPDMVDKAFRDADAQIARLVA